MILRWEIQISILYSTSLLLMSHGDNFLKLFYFKLFFRSRMDRTHHRPERQGRGRRHQPGGVHRDEHPEPSPELGNELRVGRNRPRGQRQRARASRFQRVRPKPRRISDQSRTQEDFKENDWSAGAVVFCIGSVWLTKAFDVSRLNSMLKAPNLIGA